MRNSAFSSFAAYFLRTTCRSLAGLVLVFGAIAFLFTPSVSAQNSKTEGVLPAPSEGKAVVCIYRTYRFTGSAAHDEIFVNEKHLGKLLNSEYMFTEVPPGAVVIAGLPKVYYGDIIMTAGALLSETRKKENERARFEAEAGKIYYFKWISEPMGMGIKVTAVEPGAGAKDIRKLHISKPPDDKEGAKPEAKNAETPAQP